MKTWKDFKLDRISLTIGEKSFTLDKIKDIDSYFDLVLNDNSMTEDKIPYWAEMWPSAIALADYLTQNPELRTQNLLEIGCGLGLPGMYAHALGAKVTFTDHLQDPLDFLQHNWSLNFEGAPTTQLFDWNGGNLEPATRNFELVIASDIAYERKFQKPLYDFIKETHSKKIKFILTEPNRDLAVEFLNSLKEIDPDLKRSQRIVEMGGLQNKINIIEIG